MAAIVAALLAMAMRSLDLQALSLLLRYGDDHHFDHHLGLSTEIRLSAESLFSRKIGRLRTLLDTLPMSGGQRATSSKSHRPDILTPLIDLSVWIQSDFGEGERRSIACGIAS